MADSAAHAFDAVICWKTDRLARNRYDSAVYKKKLRDNGVEILYAAESNISGAEGIIIEGLMEALAEYYSAELAEKARRGMRESALKGKALGSSRPLGLTVDADKHYIIEPTGAEQSGISLSSTRRAVLLLHRGASERHGPAAPAHGGPFNKSSINRIIQNEMYRGVYVSKSLMSASRARSRPSSTMIYGKGHRKCLNATARAAPRTPPAPIISSPANCTVESAAA